MRTPATFVFPESCDVQKIPALGLAEFASTLSCI
jgi:hypothetical protein